VYTGEDIVPSHPILVKRSELGKFEWKTLMEFRGIIHIPYEISTMSIFEHMQMGLPLFLPSKQFLLDLWQSKKAKFQSDYWSIIAKTEPPDYHQQTKDYSFWIEKADFYHADGIYYFDSFDDLLRIVVTFFKDTKYDERIHNRKEVITEQWKSLLKDIL
jgi:hypothetical protein